MSDIRHVFDDQGNPTERATFFGMTALKLLMEMWQQEKLNDLEQDIVVHIVMQLSRADGIADGTEVTVQEMEEEMKPIYMAMLKYFERDHVKFIANPSVDKFIK